MTKSKKNIASFHCQAEIKVLATTVPDFYDNKIK